MAFDLVLQGGSVVDGSGAPAYRADVGIRDGRIVEIGRLSEGAGRTVDATGLVIAPGFIDHHTHLDAQLLWDPYGTSGPEHGVTSVVTGNCALSLAPARPETQDALLKSFSRVEAMPRAALDQGITWRWNSFRGYLDAFEGRLGVNLAGSVGHVAVRHDVMGEAAVERVATAGEIESMCHVVRESMVGGAIGFSTNRNVRHLREDGKPIASRFASDDEVFALCDVLGELGTGLIQTIVGLHQPEFVDWYDALVRRTGRPLTWQNVVHRWDQPNLWREQLDAVAPIFRDGYIAYGLANTVPIIRTFSLKSAQVFDEFPVWKTLFFLPEAMRKQAFASPETREKMRANLADPKPALFHKRWDLVYVATVARPENAALVGLSVADVAARRGQDALDAFLDLSIEEDLATTFTTVSAGGDPAAMAGILNSPYVLAGVSDAGAHVQFGAGFGYSTTLLGHWVRERGVIGLELAVHKLTNQVAAVYGFSDRGLIKPGYAADIVLFDPATVGAHDPVWADDYPGGTGRYVQHSDGIVQTIVNGRVIYEDGRLTGDLPGQVLRGGAYRPE